MIRSKALLAWALGLGMCAPLAACGNSIAGGEGGSSQTVDAIAGESCDHPGDTAACDDGGDMTCVNGDDGAAWTSCEELECHEHDTQECHNTYAGGTPEQTTLTGHQDCAVGVDGRWAWGNCMDSSTITPLVISLEGKPARFTEADGNFALASDMSVGTDWVSAETPWLALDRNANGIIDDGGELFGSATALSMGGRAENGFVALAELDANHDGVVDGSDPGFASLVVWADRNQNRISEPGELSSLASVGIDSIEVGYLSNRLCDARGNCEIEAARVGFHDASGQMRSGRVADVHLRIR